MEDPERATRRYTAELAFRRQERQQLFTFVEVSTSSGTIQVPWFTPSLLLVLPASTISSESMKFNSGQHLKVARAQAEQRKRFHQFAKSKAWGLSTGFN